MKKKLVKCFLLVIAIALISTLLFVNASTKKSKKFIIGMSQSNLGEPWRVQMNNDVKKAAEKLKNLLWKKK